MAVIARGEGESEMSIKEMVNEIFGTGHTWVDTYIDTDHYKRYYPDWLGRLVWNITMGRVRLLVKPYRNCLKCDNPFADRSNREPFCSSQCFHTSGQKLHEDADKQVVRYFD